jgi:hypothetical protein
MSRPTTSTAVLGISKSDVEEGINPRTRFDEAKLAELESSEGSSATWTNGLV